MSRVLSRTEQIASYLVAAVFASSAFIASTRLLPDTTYNDFIVGAIAWNGGSKLADMLAFPVLIAVFVLAFLICNRLIAGVHPTHRSASSGVGAQLLVGGSLAFAPTAAILMGVSADPLWLHFSSLALLCLLMLHRASASREHLPTWMPAFLVFCSALLGAGPLACQLLLSRLPVDGTLPGTWDNSARVALTISAIAMITTAAIGLKRPDAMKRWHAPLALGAQCCTAALYLCLLPARIQLPDGSLTAYDAGWPLRIAILVLIVIALADVIRRFIAYQQDASSWKLLSPLALFPVILILRSGTTVSPIIHPDDYHFGEGLIGWWSYLQGRIPYVDYIPAHGLIDDDLGGMLAHLFYGGTAGAFLEARRVMYALLGLGSLLAMYRTTGSLPLAMVGVYFLAGRPGFLFLTVFACLWLYRPLIATPWRWLAVAVPSGIVAILGVPPQGLLLVAAATPLGLHAIWRCTRDPLNPQRWALVSSVALTTVLCLLTPLGAMFFAAIRYVYENGSVNQIAWGIPWAASWAIEKPSVPLELLRMSWIALPVIGIGTLVTRWMVRHNAKTEFGDVLPYAFLSIFAILLIPYTLGRIDPGVMSRPGLLSNWAWTLLLPLMCWHAGPAAARPWLISGAALLGAATGGAGIDLRQIKSAAAPTVATAPLLDGAAAGLPNLGNAHIDDHHFKRIARVAATLDRFLDPGETYLDLTSRNAHYFYTNRLPPVSVTAPLNLVSTTQQMREIRRLEATRPRVALLQAENFTADGGGVGLRSPLLARYMIENYDPEEIDGLIIGHRRQHPAIPAFSFKVDKTVSDEQDASAPPGQASIAVAATSLPDLEGARIRLSPGDVRVVLRADENRIWFEGALPPNVKAVTIEQRDQASQTRRSELWEQAFGRPDLQQVALAWGRSASSLMPLLDEVVNLRTRPMSLIDMRAEGDVLIRTGVDPQIHYALAGLSVSGRDAGILRLDLTCSGTDFARGEVFWWGDGHSGPQSENSVSFVARSGTLLIPLESSPRWLTMERVSGLRIDIDGDACHAFQLTRADLLQKKSVAALRGL